MELGFRHSPIEDLLDTEWAERMTDSMAASTKGVQSPAGDDSFTCHSGRSASQSPPVQGLATKVGMLSSEFPNPSPS